MNENNKKQKIILAIILVSVITVSIIGTYAYFLTGTSTNEEQKLTINTGSLGLIFEDNDDGLTGRIMIGESLSKELRIRNVGAGPVTTNMHWSGLVNTYLEESLSYTLQYKTTEDGDWQPVETAHENIPQSERADDYNLATNLTIPAGTTYFYKLTITFNNLLDVNQEADKTAILSAKFNLGDVVIESKSLKTLTHLNLTVKDGNPDFGEPATTDETADGLYGMEDDYGTSYYYRGAVENNYVKFGEFFWRIIRINGDGSIRMQYDGTQAYANANGGNGSGGANRVTHIDATWNTTNNNDAKYVGWMYGGNNGKVSTKQNGIDSSAATYNQTSNNVKTLVDSWYKTNIADKNLGKYVSDEIFCNDRNTAPSGSTWWTNEDSINKGFGNNNTMFGAAYRIYNSGFSAKTPEPMFVCSQKNDAFTVSDTIKGNGKLTYQVGLITADEIEAAGSGKWNTINKYYYLFKNTSYWYWSLSPRIHSGSASVFVENTGLNASSVNSTFGAVAPVINIAPEYAVALTGSGTMSSPYQIPGVE